MEVFFRLIGGTSTSDTSRVDNFALTGAKAAAIRAIVLHSTAGQALLVEAAAGGDAAGSIRART